MIGASEWYNSFNNNKLLDEEELHDFVPLKDTDVLVDILSTDVAERIDRLIWNKETTVLVDELDFIEQQRYIN